jgi:rod shape-determining protein MreD
MSQGTRDLRVAVVLTLLVLLHFTLRPMLGSPAWAPDLLLLAVMLFAIRSRPGAAAVVGFVVGLAGDALVDAAFGAGALAYSVVAYLQAWGKAVFFPDNLLVNAAFFLGGAWLRDVLVLLAGGQVRGMPLLVQLGTWSLLQAFSTTVAGLVVLIVFRRWLLIGSNQ